MPLTAPPAPAPQNEGHDRRSSRTTLAGAWLLSPLLNLLIVIAACTMFAWLKLLPAPTESHALDRTLDLPTERTLILLNAEGEPFARRGGCLDKPIRQEELPAHFIDALLAMEDRRFYSHPGVDPQGILRAALANYRAGRVVQGGSTITQQLAKITYLSGHKTLNRKLEEALIAIRLELNLEKNQILERYLSRAYFGQGCFGLRAAAGHYFGQPVDALTMSQSIFLIALLRSPTHLIRNREALRDRVRLVAQSLAATGRLDAREAAKLELATPRQRHHEPHAAYFADWISRTASPSDEAGFEPLPVRTSLQPDLQRLASQAVAEIMNKHAETSDASEAALVAMRPDGRVLAMVGGRNYSQSQFNRATQALRQPGSSFKTFAYLAALRAGARSNMLAADAPIEIGNWSPENYSRDYRGTVSLQKS